jgi:hypothetical protein
MNKGKVEQTIVQKRMEYIHVRGKHSLALHDIAECLVQGFKPKSFYFLSKKDALFVEKLAIEAMDEVI